MRRRLPGTAMLTAFESAARHQSFTAAAAELALTQSAVGRQVGALQDLLGVALFRRTRHGIALTDAGHSYLRHVVRTLDEIEREVLDLKARGGHGGSLELGVVPSFAANWLVPRLPRLRERNPELTVHLASRTRPFLFEDSGLAAAIVSSQGAWPGTRATLLMPERVVPVCCPALAGRRRRLDTEQLARLPLLQQATRPYAWRAWFAGAGLPDADALAGPRYELFSIALQAAVAGMGVALVPDYLAEPECAAGRLVVPHPHVLADLAYYLVTPAEQAESEALRAFREWLVQEVQAPAVSPG